MSAGVRASGARRPSSLRAHRASRESGVRHDFALFLLRQSEALRPRTRLGAPQTSRAHAGPSAGGGDGRSDAIDTPSRQDDQALLSHTSRHRGRTGRPCGGTDGAARICARAVTCRSMYMSFPECAAISRKTRSTICWRRQI